MNLIFSNLSQITEQSCSSSSSSSSSCSETSCMSTAESSLSNIQTGQDDAPEAILNKNDQFENLDQLDQNKLQDLEILSFSSYINKSLTERQIRDLFYKDYCLGTQIGKGGFGTIFGGMRRDDNQLVAIKVIRKANISQWYDFTSLVDGDCNDDCIYEMDCERTDHLITRRIPLEIALMIRVRNVKNCIKILDYLEQNNCFIIVMERFEFSKDLFDFITETSFASKNTQTGLDECLAKDLFKQIVETVLDIEEQGVYHRDLKDENILIDLTTNQIKLIDFGAGAFITNKKYSDFHGTRVYSPPEWFLNKSYYGDRAAVWSLGVLLFNMIYGDIPWEENDDIINCRLNIKKNLFLPSDASSSIFYRPDQLRSVDDLIKMCLSVDDSSRIKLDQILQHKWFKSYESNKNESINI